MATLLLIGNWMLRAFFDVHVKVTPKLGPRGGQATFSGAPSLTLLVKSWRLLKSPTAAM